MKVPVIFYGVKMMRVSLLIMMSVCILIVISSLEVAIFLLCLESFSYPFKLLI